MCGARNAVNKRANEISSPPLAVAILNRYFNGIGFAQIFIGDRGEGGRDISVGRAISTLLQNTRTGLITR